MAKWNEAAQTWAFEAGELEHQVEEALASEAGNAGGPQALHVAFHSKTRRFTVYMNNGVNFSFPADLCQGLKGRDARDLEDVHVLSDGDTLEWPRLDIHFAASGLALGLLGSERWMTQIRDDAMRDAARRAGRATSEKKRASSAANGRSGGRPRKTIAFREGISNG